MIQRYVVDLALQMSLPTVQVSVIDGERIGCLDAYLVHIVEQGHKVSAIVYQSDLDCISNGEISERLEARIGAALQRLKLLLEP